MVPFRQKDSSLRESTGFERKVFAAIFDFHKLEPSTIPDYTRPPLFPLSYYLEPKLLFDGDKRVQRLLSTEQRVAFQKYFGVVEEFFDCRWTPNCMAGQTVWGMAGQVHTTQDALPIFDRTNSHWVRLKEDLPDTEQQYAACS